MEPYNQIDISTNEGMMKKSNEGSLSTEETEDIKAILQVMAFVEKYGGWRG